MSQMNESCLIQVSHVSFEWVMSQMNDSCLIQVSHVSFEWVMSQMNEHRDADAQCLSAMTYMTYRNHNEVYHGGVNTTSEIHGPVYLHSTRTISRFKHIDHDGAGIRQWCESVFILFNKYTLKKGGQRTGWADVLFAQGSPTFEKCRLCTIG